MPHVAPFRATQGRAVQLSNQDVYCVRIYLPLGMVDRTKLDGRKCKYATFAVVPMEIAALLADMLRIFLDKYYESNMVTDDGDPAHFGQFNGQFESASEYLGSADIFAVFESLEQHLIKEYGWESAEKRKVNKRSNKGTTVDKLKWVMEHLKESGALQERTHNMLGDARSDINRTMKVVQKTDDHAVLTHQRVLDIGHREKA